MSNPRHIRSDRTLEGEARKRSSFSRLETHRRVLIRRAQRALIEVLLIHGEATIDDARERIRIPPGINPKCLGPTAPILARAGIIRDSGRAIKSSRPEAHARKVTVWELADRAAALDWLDRHPDPPDPEPEPVSKMPPSNTSAQLPTIPTTSRQLSLF